MSEIDNTASPLFKEFRFYFIIVLLSVVIVFLAVDRFWPTAKLSDQNVQQMQQLVNTMQDVSTAITNASNQLNDSNQQIQLFLTGRGTNREQLYQSLLAQYGFPDTGGVQPRPDGIGSQHPPASNSADHPAK